MVGGTSKRRAWRLAGLPADPPSGASRKKLMLFGQFVGDWDILRWRSRRSARDPRRRVGEVHFAWVLNGQAIQDTWGGLDPTSDRFVAAGTTLRFYDRFLDAWRSTWISPGSDRNQTIRRFVGRKVGTEIVLKEEARGNRTERWIFFDIHPASFRWRAERRATAGGSWKIVEEMELARTN